MSDIESRISKFIRKAPMVGSKAHLDKIMETFPEENRAAILRRIENFLPFSPYIVPESPLTQEKANQPEPMRTVPNKSEPKRTKPKAKPKKK